MSKVPGTNLLGEKSLDYLKENVSLGNVCECLILADLHKDEHLKSVAQAFFLENSDDIIASEEWKKLVREDIGLAANTMIWLCWKKIRMSKVPGTELLGGKPLDFLKENVSLGNVCECLILADLHKDEHLKSVAQAYFLEHSNVIMGSEEWKELERENIGLAAKTLRLLCLKKIRMSKVTGTELLGEKSLDFLKENVSLGNVCECLFLADLHKDEHLKSVAQAFFLENSDDIIDSEEWGKLARENIGLVVNTMIWLCWEKIRMSKVPGTELLGEKPLDFLKENVSLANVCECLILADLHKDKHLQSVAQAYFLEYSNVIMDSEEWKELERENIGLAAKTLRLKKDKDV